MSKVLISDPPIVNRVISSGLRIVSEPVIILSVRSVISASYLRLVNIEAKKGAMRRLPLKLGCYGLPFRHLSRKSERS